MPKTKLKVYNIHDAQAGMMLGTAVLSDNGKVMLSEGTRLTDALIEKLKWWGINDIKVITEPATLDKGISPIQQLFYDGYEQTVEKVKTSFQNIRYFKEVPIAEMNELAKGKIAELIDTVGVINHLHMVRRTDDYTFHHSINVAVICGVLGRWLGFTGDKLQGVILAGLLHDVGKTQIPLEILNKPDKLTDSEMKIMQQHTVHGFNLLKKLPDISPEVVMATMQHHEKIDGTGYPLGLKDSDIHEFSRVVAIADIYDAMTSDRVYHKKVTPFEVVEIITDEMYKKLDPKVCTVFLNNVREYFIGNRVGLNDGRQAEVIFLGQFMSTRPTVKTEDEEFIDLEKRKDLSIIKLLET